MNDMTAPSEPDPSRMPESTGGTATLVEEDTRLSPNAGGDHERFAHYVRKEKIVESAVVGSPVVALCGKVWVPNRDPGKFPVCPECKDIYESMRGGDEGQSGSDQ